jgi:hypothetical protein
MRLNDNHYLSQLAIVVICVISIAGCDTSRPGMVPVSGRVTIDGKPVTAGQITVMPEGHRASIGKLDAEGRFTLSCFEPGDGAPIGQHIATVTSVESIDDHANRWHAPKQYANKANGVWVNIDGPTDNLKVELTWANSNQKGSFVENF